MTRNEFVIEGVVGELSPLRYTPAGIPVIEFRLAHRSEQMEAGRAREIQVELSVVALGDAALAAKPLALGGRVAVKGFLARRGLKSAYPVLHATRIRISQE